MASYVPWWQTPWAGGNMAAPGVGNQVPDENTPGFAEDARRRAMLRQGPPLPNAPANLPALPQEAANTLMGQRPQQGLTLQEAMLGHQRAMQQPAQGGYQNPGAFLPGAGQTSAVPVDPGPPMDPPRQSSNMAPWSVAARERAQQIAGVPFTAIQASPMGFRDGNVVLESSQRPTAALGGATPQEWAGMTQQQRDNLMLSWRPQPGAAATTDPRGTYAQNYGPNAMPNMQAFFLSDTRDRNGNIVQNFNAPAFEAAMRAYGDRQKLPLDQAKLDLDRMSLLGIPGTPGRLQTDAARVAQEGRAADIQHGPDAVNERNFTAFLQSVLQSGGSIQDARRRWVENGSPLPPSQGGGSLLGGSNTAPPTQAQTGATSPPPPGTNSASTTTAAATAAAPPLTESPLSQMQNALRLLRAQGGGVPGQVRDLTTDDVTRFVNNLGGRFVQENSQALMPFMVQQFGSNVVDPWFSQRTWRLGQQTPDEVARQAIMQAVNARQPQTVGNSSVNRQMPTRWLNPITWLPW